MIKDRRSSKQARAARADIHWTRSGVVFGVCVAAAAYVSFAVTAAQIVRNKLPEQALLLNPFDSLAPALAVERKMTRNYRALSTPAVKELLYDAVTRQPLNSRAVRLLGYVEDVRGNRAAASKVLKLAESLSRRDAGTQLWLLEDAVRGNDVPAVLAHYDRMLRTSNDSRNVLFPILTSALSNAEVRASFAKFIRNPPPWLSTYLSYAILEGRDPASIADAIAVAGGLPRTLQFQLLSSQLLDRLVSASQFSRARQYYLSLPGREATALQSVGLTEASVDTSFGPIAWQPTVSGSSGAELAAHGRQLYFRIYGASGERTSVARKMLMLLPGKYAFSFSTFSTESDSDSAIGVVVGCKAGTVDTILLDSRVALGSGRRKHQVAFTVPSACEAQFVTFQAIGGLGEAGIDAEVYSLGLATQ